MKIPFAASLLVLSVSFTGAWARGGDIGVCADTPNSEAAIAACTRLYENAGLSGHNRAIVLGNRAAAFKMLGKYDEAIADLGTAVDLDPRNPQYHCQRGDILLKRGSFAEAIPDYDAAIKVAPSLTWARYGRGQAYLAQGNADLAAADFDEALRTKPGTTNYLFFRGRANAQRKQYEPAESDFKKVLATPDLKRRLPKEQSAVLTLHAFSLLKLHRAAEAKPDVEAALRLTPKSSFALTVMGAIEEQLGRKTEAKDYFKRALAVDPKAEVAQRALARLDKADATVATAQEPPGIDLPASVTDPAKPAAGPAKADTESATTAPEAVAETEKPAAKPAAEPAKPASEPTKAVEPEKKEKVASDDDGAAAPAEDLCARYFPTVGQTLLVACGR